MSQPDATEPPGTNGDTPGRAQQPVVAGHCSRPPARPCGLPSAGDVAPLHSPLPWRLEELRSGKVRVLDGRGHVVLHCPARCTARDHANMELIVRAANAGLPEVAAQAFTIVHESGRHEDITPGALAPVGGA